MNISQKGIDLIKEFEGCRLTAYKDASFTEVLLMRIFDNGLNLIKEFQLVSTLTLTYTD